MTDKPAIEGWRKMGIGMAGLWFMSEAQDLYLAGIIGLVTAFCVACQTYLDRKKGTS